MLETITPATTCIIVDEHVARRDTRKHTNAFATSGGTDTQGCAWQMHELLAASTGKH